MNEFVLDGPERSKGDVVRLIALDGVARQYMVLGVEPGPEPGTQRCVLAPDPEDS